MIHLRMIFYDKETESMIPEGFIGLANTNPLRKDLFEVEPILRFITENQINDSDFYGFFSPRIFEKTGLDANDICSLDEKQLHRFDIISLDPGPVNLEQFSNSVAQGETGHGDFRWRFEYLISAINYSKKLHLDTFINFHVPERYFLLSHYFIAKGSFWKSWAVIVNEIFQFESCDKRYNEIINSRCLYERNLTEYTYIVFLIERVAGLIAFSENLTIFEAFLRTRWLNEFNKRKWPKSLVSIGSYLYKLEFAMRGANQRPFIAHFVVKKLIYIHTVIDNRLKYFMKQERSRLN